MDIDLPGQDFLEVSLEASISIFISSKIILALSWRKRKKWTRG
jgi:hypothetical protein